MFDIAETLALTLTLTTITDNTATTSATDFLLDFVFGFLLGRVQKPFPPRDQTHARYAKPPHYHQNFGRGGVNPKRPA